MIDKCLYCYEPLEREEDFHKRCSLKFFGSALPPRLPYSIDQMAELAKDTVERSIAVPGVQPKLSMSILEESQKDKHRRLTVVGTLGGQYILKPPSDQFPEMPENEHVTMRMAEAYGIRVVPSSLIRLASGELSYITKRIDRTEAGEKIHMLDMFQITEAFDKYKGSVEKVGKALHTYSDNPLLDMVFYFELLVFGFLTGNNDMHLKNFSMIESPSGWVLSPAYDLLNVAIVFPEDTDELALTLEGKRKKLQRAHFARLGEGLTLTNKQVQGVFERTINHQPRAIEWIDQSFLSRDMKEAYKEVLEARYERLSIARK